MAWSTYGWRSAGVHDDQSASVTSPDTLQATCSSSANGGDQRPPWLERAGRDRRLGQVVDDEPDVRQAPGQLQRRRQLARPDQQVVGQPGRPDRARCPRTTSSRSSHSGSGSSWTWWRMPTSRSPPGPARSAAMRLGDGGIRQVDPADDPADERRAPRRAPGTRPSPPGSSGSGRGPWRRRRRLRARARGRRA